MKYEVCAAIAGALLVAACASNAPVRISAGDAFHGRAPVELTVDNRGATDITVFVVHDGRAERLDRVEAARTKRLLVPARMLDGIGELQLIGERPGTRMGFGGRVTSQRVSLQRCQRLEWSIEAPLEHSSLGVFPVRRCG